MTSLLASQSRRLVLPISRVVSPSCQLLIQRRDANTKPWKAGPIESWKKGIPDYTYRWGRAKKVAKIKLPDVDNADARRNSFSPEEYRSFLKQKGIVPHRSWDEKPIVLTCTGDIVEPYKPPKEEPFSGSVLAKKTRDAAVKAFKKVYHRPVTKIREYLGDFDPTVFASTEATEIYCKAHQELMKLSAATDLEYTEHEILKYVTEKALPDMLFRTENKTIKWKLLQSLEEPKVVHVTTAPGLNPGILFGQVTVRMHTQQMLAVYDRFGRLILGSEHAVKDVLEYVVFENYLSNKYGVWRMHGKIIPDQIVSSKNPAIPTMKLKHHTENQPVVPQEKPSQVV